MHTFVPASPKCDIEFRASLCSLTVISETDFAPAASLSPFLNKSHPLNLPLSCPPIKPPFLRHHPLRLLTEPQQESAALMDATDGLSLGAASLNAVCDRQGQKPGLPMKCML